MFQQEVANDVLSGLVIKSAIKVHRRIGPGLLESAYQICLQYELENQGVKVETEVAIPVQYDQITLDAGYRADMLVNEELLIELKAIKRIEPIHKSQLLTYLRLSGLKRGLLINFNVGILRDGIHRVANNYGK